jgi:nucleotide-binding universal stress UspA family protein
MRRPRTSRRRGPRPILHPTDFSPASGAAFRAAVALARAERAPLVLVHVVPPVVRVPEVYVASPPAYERFRRAVAAASRRRLARLVAGARAAGGRASGLVLEGVPHERIVAAARSRRAGLIVMGTHGRSGLPRMLLGSVAARVLALAPCPVLTVRGRAR